MYIATTETTTMIEWAGYDVAMANAIPEVREITKKTRRGATIQELVLKKYAPHKRVLF
ncbi:HAD hydrolase family protein [Bacillus subtilis]|uniref:HAD hydrolase family protein n=1 Tax=Bacillus subtilis TaxID=1423 RepID=UPI0013709589|nr:HAD hydrolase family protein [Bacillus subtilis]